MRKHTKAAKTLKALLSMALVFQMAFSIPASAATVTSKTPNFSTTKMNSGTIVVKTDAGTRKYKTYKQIGSSSYINANGCIMTAVSVAASGFGKNYSPNKIHTGSVSKKYSERYALKKLKYSSALYGRAAISVKTAVQILKDMGISAKARYSYKKADAVKEITAHLKAGKPVILKCNSKSFKGAKVANGHHAIVLLSLEKDGTVVFYDPFYGKLNYCHASRKYLYCSLKYLLDHHCTPASGKYNTGYVTSLNAAGGYILVG